MIIHFFIIFVTLVSYGNGLLYPGSTFSLVHSVSVPVVEYLPDRRILVDWCFSMGFALPTKLSSFYNIPIWPGHSKRSIDDNQIFSTTSTNDTDMEPYKKYQGADGIKVNKHPKDFTAGELYQSFEDLLHSYGIHETCLLRMVCELSRHPFEDRQENIFTETVTFLLTPSLHQGFDQSESLYRETYEQAEIDGFLGKDCAMLYAECKTNLLDSMTKVIFD